MQGRGRQQGGANASPAAWMTAVTQFQDRDGGTPDRRTKEEKRMIGAIITWIVVGAIAGWLASLVVRGTGLGLGGDIVVGIIGGIIGGIILSLFGGAGVTGFNIWSIIVAFIGAVILLLLI